MTQSFFVVLDGSLFRLSESERRLAVSVPDRAVRPQPLLEHPEQHRHLTVHIVAYPDLGLPRMAPMEMAGVIESLTDVP
jgi:hypothetical protein